MTKKVLAAMLSGLLAVSNSTMIYAEETSSIPEDTSGYVTTGLYPENDEIHDLNEVVSPMDTAEVSHDVNQDGATDEQDILAILEFAAKLNSATVDPEEIYPDIYETGDLTEDGMINAIDAIELARLLDQNPVSHIDAGAEAAKTETVSLYDTEVWGYDDNIVCGVYSAEFDAAVTSYVSVTTNADYTYAFYEEKSSKVFIAFADLEGFGTNEPFAEVEFASPEEVTEITIVTWENNGDVPMDTVYRTVEIGGAPVVTDPIFINSRSVELEEKINARIYVYVPDSELETTYVTTTFNGTSKTEYALTMETATRSGRLCRVVSVDTFAKQMRDDIVVKVHEEDGTPKYLEYKEEDVTDGYVFHVEDYVKSVEENATDEKLIDLVHKMNWYGLYAQKQFKYNPVEFEEPAVITNFNDAVLNDYAVQNTGTANGITYTSGSLQLDSDTGIKVNYTLTGTDTISDYTFTVDGTAVQPKLVSGKKYYVTYKGIPAKKLNEWHTVTVTDKAGNTLTTKYCGLTYTYSVVSNASAPDTLKDLCRSIYLYWEAAYNYFPKTSN